MRGRPPAKVNNEASAKRDIVNLLHRRSKFPERWYLPTSRRSLKKFLEKYPNDELSSKARHY